MSDPICLAEALVLAEDLLDNQVLLRKGAEAEREAFRKCVESFYFHTKLLIARAKTQQQVVVERLRVDARDLRFWAREQRERNGVASDLWDGRAEREADCLEFAAQWLER